MKHRFGYSTILLASFAVMLLGVFLFFPSSAHAAITFGDSSVTAGGSASITAPDMPAGLATGDYIFLLVSIYGHNVEELTNPSGYTFLAELEKGNQSWNVHGRIYGKVATAADVSNWHTYADFTMASAVLYTYAAGYYTGTASDQSGAVTASGTGTLSGSPDVISATQLTGYPSNSWSIQFAISNSAYSSSSITGTNTLRAGGVGFDATPGVLWQDSNGIDADPAGAYDATFTNMGGIQYGWYHTTLTPAAGGAPPADTTPPVISGVTATNITQTAATIVWTTDESADSQVEFCLTATACGNNTPLVTALTTSHSLNLTNLVTGTTYYYWVKSKDASGNLATSTVRSFTTNLSPTESNMWVTAYYAGWLEGRLPVDEIDFDALTHIIHFSTVPNADGTLNYFNLSPSTIPAIVSTVHAHNKKILFTVGGAYTRPQFQTAMNSTNRARFVSNIMGFINTWGYDGVDIDMEPMDCCAADFQEFITELRAALDAQNPNLLLTIAAGNPAMISPVQDKFDQINIMTYDMSGAYPGWVTWHNSPIENSGHTFPSTGGLLPSINIAVDAFINGGISKDKLAIGTAFYGVLWSGGTGTDTGGVTRPEQTWSTPPNISSGLGHWWLRQTYDLTTTKWDTVGQAAYLSIDNTGSANDAFVSFDNEQSIQAKVDYVRNKGIAGIMIFELGLGYAFEYPVGQRDPLLQAIKQAVFGGSPPPDTTPPVISGIQASSITQTAATISWTTNEAATSQVEFCLTTTPCGNNTPLVSALTTSHTINLSSLTAATTYYYWVKSTDVAGNSATSSIRQFITGTVSTLAVSLSASPTSGTAPLSGVSLTATVSGGGPGNINYTFYCNRSDIGTNITTPYNHKFDNSAQTTYTATSVCSYTSAGTYTAKVIVERGVGAAEARTAVEAVAVADTTAPVITNTSISNVTQAAATITWTTNEGATSQVAFGLTSTYGMLSTVNAILATAHSVTLSNLSAGTTYHYRVHSQDAAGNLATGIDRTFTTQAAPTPDTTPPATTTTLSATEITATSAKLTWTAPGDDGSTGTASSYDIRYQTNTLTSGTFSSATQVSGEPTPALAGTAQSYTLTGLSAETAYGVAITATDEAGNVSALSNIVAFTTQSASTDTSDDKVAPPPVANFRALPTDSQASLSWTNPTTSTDWVRTIIVRKQGSAPVSVNDGTLVFEGTTSSIVDMGLTNGATYYYAAFTLDRVPNYSSAALAIVTPEAGVEQISQIPDEAAQQTTPGESFTMPAGLTEGDLIRGPDGIKVYIINEHGYRRHIFNPVVFNLYGHFDWASIKPIPQTTVEVFTTSDFYRAEGDTRVFSLKELNEAQGLAQKRWLNITANDFTTLGFDWNQVFIINTAERDYYQEGTPLSLAELQGTTVTADLRQVLAKSPDSATVYYINDQGIKKAIPTEEIFFSYGNQFQDVLTISSKELAQYPDRQGIRLTGDDRVYLLENNTKRWVSTEDAFSAQGLDWGRIIEVNEVEFEWYGEGAQL